MTDFKITYERDIEHCTVSPYIKFVTISDVYNAINSDMLDCVKFDEIGWQAVSARGTRKVGDRVLFIPAESVLPFELGELLDVTKYLSKGRVRVTSLRGNRSEGIIVEEDVIGPYIPYIMKWEDLPSISMCGQQLAAAEISPYIHRFYKMPNILNEPKTFDVGETIHYSEKIHGTNWRVGILPHPVTEELMLYTGSHDVVLQLTGENVYVRAATAVQENLPEGILFFGEIFGRGIQHLNYGTVFGYRFFAATRRGEYLPIDEFTQICKLHNLPYVELSKIIFTGDIEPIRQLSEGQSEYADHIKEGIVMVSDKYPERMAKCISFVYLENKNGKRKRTERH